MAADTKNITPQTTRFSWKSALATAPKEPRISLLLYYREGVEALPLLPGRSVVVGRDAPSEVRLPDESLSRQHARFELRGAEVWVEDLGSTNGTRVGGGLVRASAVRPGDEVFLGGVRVAIHALAPSDEEQRGVDSYDRFFGDLEQELVRHRTFGRKLGLIMVHADNPRAELHVWSPRVRRLLRPVDRVGLYSAAAIEIAVPETEPAALRTLAETLAHEGGAADLRCGIALFPDSGTSADALLEAARAAAQQAAREQPVQLAAAARSASVSAPGGVVVVSKAMCEVMESATRVARSPIPVLIYGETGTGKEVVARAIHAASDRQGKPLRCINCGAIPASLIESTLFGHERGAFTGADRQAKGIFEEASGGTILLDEIGELPAQAQASLLRVLETKRIARVGSTAEIPVDVRVLAATHRDLEAMCDVERFRWDLLFRLNTVTLHIPPLRDRIEEVAPLAELFLKEAREASHTAVRSVDPQALSILQRYPWPGNVRELRNVIHRAVVLARGEHLGAEDLPEKLRALATTAEREVAGAGVVAPPAEKAGPEQAGSDDGGDLRARVQRYEAGLVRAALESTGWVQTEAAKRLGIPVRTLSYKIKTLGIERP